LNLSNLVNDPHTRSAIQAKLEIAKNNTKFCRDWRNRRIAHKDLDLAIDNGAKPLESATRISVRKALRAIADVLNEIDAVYLDSETYFEGPSAIGGAVPFLYALDAGLRAQEQRSERLSRGQWSEEDLPRNL